MTSNIVLPNLTNWTEQHLQALIQTTSSDEFDAAVDAFFAKDVKITVNGVHFTREQYKQQFRAEASGNFSATVKFNGAVEVPANANEPINAGVVGVFLTATILKKLIIFGAHGETKLTSSVNVVIIQDPTLKPPTLPTGVHGFFDGRRVSVLSQVSDEEPVQPVPPSNWNEGGGVEA